MIEGAVRKKMPEYEAWLPVVVYVKVGLDQPEAFSTKEMQNPDKLAELFREQGETLLPELCSICEEGLDISELDLEITTVPQSLKGLKCLRR